MFRRENVVDLRDFMALVSVDDSKFVRQFFVVAGMEERTSGSNIASWRLGVSIRVVSINLLLKMEAAFGSIAVFKSLIDSVFTGPGNLQRSSLVGNHWC